MHTDWLEDVFFISRLKARYFRYVDTKQWDLLRDLFVDDFKFFYDLTPTPSSSSPSVEGADAFVASVAGPAASVMSVHHGHMPEIEFDSAQRARGIWAMFDWVSNPARSYDLRGYGHYHDTYTKESDGLWRISEMRLTRLTVERRRDV